MNIIIKMRNLLLNQFLQQNMQSYFVRWTSIAGSKSPVIINQLFPQCYQNLTRSTKEFIDALVDLDEDFIGSTATPQLQALIIPQMNKLRANEGYIKVLGEDQNNKTAGVEHKQDHDTIKNHQKFAYPYVIFGQKMSQRILMPNPWENIRRLSSNRYVKSKSSLDQIRKDHIYGFHCFYRSSNQYQVAEGSHVHVVEDLQFQVSFETDATEYEFYVSDFNNLIQKQL